MAKYHVFRLKPDEEIVAGIRRYIEERNIKSGLVLGIIGSLNEVELSFLKSVPGNYITVKYRGPLEIVSAQGNIGMDEDNSPIAHIHMVVSNEFTAVGGHLTSGRIFTTAEVAILEFEGEVSIRRKHDEWSGLKEMEIEG